MLVDTHCHLDFRQFDADRDEVVGRAKDILIVNSTVDADGVDRGLRLSDEYDNVRCMLGLSASEVDGAKAGRMIELIRENRRHIIGIGEAGLDYHWVKDDVGRQKEREYFTEIVGLSLELGLPLLVHSRDAESDCINILRGRKVRAIMHCFSGTIQEAFEAVDLGCLVSIPADVTRSKGRQRLVKELPLDSMVLESDAPYLAPVRGERNEPANVRLTCERIAQLKDVSAASVADATTENALDFLKIKT